MRGDKASRELLCAVVFEASLIFRVHQRDITGDYKFRFVTRTRFAICKALRSCGYSYPKIAEAFGQHHTTVMHAVTTAEKRMETHPSYREKVEVLTEASRKWKEQLDDRA